MKNLAGFRKNFDRGLLAYLEVKNHQLAQIDSQTALLINEIEGMVLAGGKRLRPAFCYFGYLACGGKDKKAILGPCCALELLHLFILIHDDIIDNSSLRRGKQTLFKKHGLPTAILAGDFACTLADEIFTNLPFPSRLAKKAKRYLDLLKEEVVAGEYLDVLGGKSEKEILKVLEYKTARYSVVRPLQIGAVLAQAPDNIFKKFEDYGIPLGIAFQIKDDILGMFGEEDIIGKPVDSDLKEGKKTLLVIKALKKAGKEEKRKLTTLLGNKEVGKKELEWVRKLMIETGALAYSESLAKKLIQQAKTVIAPLPLAKAGREFLVEMTDFVLKRNY